MLLIFNDLTIDKSFVGKNVCVFLKEGVVKIQVSVLLKNILVFSTDSIINPSSNFNISGWDHYNTITLYMYMY